jgi:class 3 adenylate cyclase
VTVLFADLTGFTTYSEQVEPSEAVAILNDAFAAAIPVVREAGGTIVQFAGDAMMVIWNAPRRQPDHARLACLAALGLQRATARLGADPGHPRFRVGVNTGPALVGNIGSDDARNFTAIGDATNLAARLQTFAPPGSVAVGPRTWELVEAIAEGRDLGPQPLKGKAEPVRIRELIAIHDLPDGDAPSAVREIATPSAPV